ncbi:MAG: hypothetical protein MJY53_01940 [Bacteroidales bacterium]|nr:hypothetical protein [Bacteroidales bacterium]
MKKLSIVLLAAAIVALPSCKNNNKNAGEQEAKDYSESTASEIVEETLKADLTNLIQSAKSIKPVPFIKAQKDGKLVLSEKEKMVKPDYLLNPSITSKLATLYQKYRAVGMLTTDKNIADMYEMPISDYNEAIFKVLTDINDPALMNFYTLPSIDIESDREAFSTFVDEEYEEDRANFFWDGIAAAMVEQVFILTRDVDKFMPMFTDELAADITFNFVCVHDGLTKMVDAYPEMASLNEVLTPLYVINAINVEQLREQLLSVKEDVENARAFLLK